MASAPSRMNISHHPHHTSRHHHFDSGTGMNASGSYSSNNNGSSCSSTDLKHEHIMAELTNNNNNNSGTFNNGAFFTWQRFLPAICMSIATFFLLVFARPVWVLDDNNCIVFTRVLFWTIMVAFLVFFMPWIVDMVKSMFKKSS